MLLVVTFSVLLCGVLFGWIFSTENTLAILLTGIGLIILFPLAIVGGVLTIILSILSGSIPVLGDWGMLLGGFVDGAYGISGWYYVFGSIVLWFLAIVQFADQENDKENGVQDNNKGKELTDIRGIGPQVETRLQESGYQSVDDLKAGSRSDLAEISGIPNTSVDRIKAEVGDFDGQSDPQNESTNNKSDVDTDEPQSLESISGVGTSKGEALRNAGFESVHDIKEADQDDLTAVKGFGNALAARVKADVGDLDVYEDTESTESSADLTVKTEARGDTTGIPNQNQPTKTASQESIGEDDISNKRLETLQQSAESHVHTAMSAPFDDPDTTQYHLERARSEYGTLVGRAKEQDADDILESAREAFQAVKTQLDTFSTITDSLETARESVSTDSEPAPTPSASKEDFETACKAYETAIDAAKEADFDTDEPEREYEAIVTELEQRRRDDLTAAIEEAGAELGYIPTLAEVVAQRDIEEAAYQETFGTWEAALEASNIDREVAVIEDLRAVEDNTAGALDEATYRREGQYDLSRLRSTFGSWSEALDHAFGEGDVTTDEDGALIVVTNPTRDDYIVAINQVADASDQVVKSTDVRDQSPYSVNEMVHEFGSWRDALEAAGVDNESRLLREIQRVANEVGHRPSTTEMNEYGHVSAAMYADYFGTYTNAVDEVFRSADNSVSANTDVKNGGNAEGNENNEDTDSDGDRERVDTDDKPVFATIDGITEDGRLGRPLAVKVSRVADDPGTRKHARLLVEDLERTQCWLNVWQKHDITVSWELGHWYVLEQVRGKYWTDGRGETGRKLSSTADLQVDHIGTDQPSRTIRDTETVETGSGSNQENSESDQVASETTDDGPGESNDNTEESENILDDLIDEFDDLVPESS